MQLLVVGYDCGGGGDDDNKWSCKELSGVQNTMNSCDFPFMVLRTAVIN